MALRDAVCNLCTVCSVNGLHFLKKYRHLGIQSIALNCIWMKYDFSWASIL